MRKLLLAGLVGIWTTGAFAHSALESTMPADEEVVAEVPLMVAFDFKKDIRLTLVTMVHADHPSVDLDLSGHNGFITDYALPMQPMGNGTYVIEWRGLGTDGHAINGSFSFTVE